MPDQPAAPGRSGPHHFYVYRGTPQEIGRQHGRSLAKEIVAELAPALEGQAAALGVSTTAYAHAFHRKYRDLVEQLTPGLSQEIAGIAEGAGLDYESAFFAALRDGAPRLGADESCTVVAMGPTGKHGPLYGQTKDTSAPLERYRIQRHERADGTRLLVLNYAGWVGNIFLSSHGLSIGGNSLYGPQSPDALPFSILKRIAMDSTSLDEIESRAAGHVWTNGCKSVMDRDGAILCFESLNGVTRVLRVAGGPWAHTNHVLDDDLRACEDHEGQHLCTFDRYNRAMALLRDQSGSPAVAGMIRIMSDHEGQPRPICRHGVFQPDQWTTAAFVADPRQQVMHIAIGNPCTAPFHVYPLFADHR